MSWGKLGLDWLGDRIGYHNNPPPVNIPANGPNTNPYGFGTKPTGQQTSVQTNSPQPVYPGLDPSGGSTIGDSGGGIDLGSIGGGILDFVKNHGGDILSAIGDFAKQHGTDALAAYNVYLAAQRQAQADKYSQGALEGTQDRFNAKAPLRALGIAGLSNPGANTPDLSNIRQMSTAGSGNPFAKALPVAGAAAPFKTPPVPGAAPPPQSGPIPVVPPNPDGSIWLPGGAKPQSALPVAPPVAPPGTPQKKALPVAGATY